jgi:hypothetical protein
MIAVRLEGRLGNQLFQYAFAYNVARKLNTSFYIDKSIENFLLPEYFEVKSDLLTPLDRNIFSIPGYKNIFKIHAKRAFYNTLSSILFQKNIIIIDNETPVNTNLQKVKNNAIYNGYFFSQSYFDDFKDEIRQLFKIKNKHRIAFQKVNELLSLTKRKVVVHVRRTDFVGLNISLPLSYYKKAIGLVDAADIEFIFISDDPLFIEQQFGYVANKYVSTNEEIIDLQFLINADICILSNSSFSWWGAWLNHKENKQIFAPKYWLGFRVNEEIPLGVAEKINFNWIEV